MGEDGTTAVAAAGALDDWHRERLRLLVGTAGVRDEEEERC